MIALSRVRSDANIGVYNPIWGFILCCLLLVGCSSSNYAPVKDLERPKTVNTGQHRVKTGETLYSIAWRYGRDYKELARSNGIAAPYAIKPGQVISLAKARSTTKSTTNSSKTSAKTSKTKTAATHKTSSQKTSKTAVWQPLRWRWPTQGKVVGYFGKAGSKGINIKAPVGQAVLAAAPGSVVYAGNGLLGYGNLVIIKHNDDFLSAYAHNRKLYVSENKKVKAGEKIAEIGSTGAQQTMLHFEIRRRGKPVNPLSYLPTLR